MTAPSPTVRGTPGGIPLRDGFSSKITLANDTDIEFWEKSVKPPSYDGGEPVDTKTMFNSVFATQAPRSLINVGDVTCKCAYDPKVLTSILAVINDETTITVTYRDGSTWAAYGYLRIFDPDEMTEGQQPEATCTFTITNTDPATGAEAAPVVTEVAGS